MKETVKPIADLLQKRIDNRTKVNETLANATLDSVPEKVKIMREEEAAKNRAIIQELRDVLDSIKALYPDT